MQNAKNPIYSGAVSLKATGNQRYGDTIGTLKLYETSYDTDDKSILEKLPTHNGFIIMDAEAAQKSVVTGTDGTVKILVNVAVWNAKPTNTKKKD